MEGTVRERWRGKHELLIWPHVTPNPGRDAFYSRFANPPPLQYDPPPHSPYQTLSRQPLTPICPRPTRLLRTLPTRVTRRARSVRQQARAARRSPYDRRYKRWQGTLCPYEHHFCHSPLRSFLVYDILKGQADNADRPPPSRGQDRELAQATGGIAAHMCATISISISITTTTRRGR